MMRAIEATHLSKRYGQKWSLNDCTFQVSQGSIVGLIGPNGAGKTTLIQLLMGLLKPTQGEVLVLEHTPNDAHYLLPKVGFVAQDHPLYTSFTVQDTLKMGQKLNTSWDNAMARARLEALEIPFQQRIGKLSGGQRAQVALVLALAKQPEVLILDEPVASLDPIARRNFLQVLMETVTQTTMTVIFSSHLITDIERICDHVILLASSHLQLSGEIEDILASHALLMGPLERVHSLEKVHTVLSKRATERQCILLVRLNGPLLDPAWERRDLSLEDIMLAYMDRSPLNPLPQQNKVQLEVLR